METKEYRKRQHWLDLENLLTPILEPIHGLYTCIWPIGRLDTSKWSMFVCFGKFFSGWKKFPKIGAPPSVLGVPLETLSPQTHLKSYDGLKCCCWSLECSLECKNGLLGTNFTDMGRNHHRQKIKKNSFGISGSSGTIWHAACVDLLSLVFLNWTSAQANFLKPRKKQKLKRCRV